MSNIPSPKNAASLLYHLHQRQNFKHQQVSGSEPDAQMALLRRWQSERLAQTYNDLKENPRYLLAVTFFLEDLYGPKDFTQRDHDLEQIYNFMKKFLPERVIHPVALAIELHYLSQALDNALLNILVNQLGVSNSITAAQYAEAYRLCDNYKDRVYQIELTKDIGRRLDKLARIPFIGTTLRLARRPAHQAGWFELQAFLERGFAAFKHMKGAKKFLKTLEKREKTILDNIYNNKPDPFDL